MIRAGLVSITFRKRSPSDIVALVVRAGHHAIEWGGDLHVPHGDLEQAFDVKNMTQDAGLTCAAYGSYYRIGHSEKDDFHFEAVRDTACALGATAIRVWAGNKPLRDVDDAYRASIVDEARRIADLAAEVSLPVVFEYHAGTLTETDASAQQFLEEVNHPNVRTLWQPPNGVDPRINLAGLRAVLPHVFYMHVFHWWPTARERHPLADGKDAWLPYLRALHATGRDSLAMIEYVQNDDPENYLRDAATLNAWLDHVS